MMYFCLQAELTQAGLIIPCEYNSMYSISILELWLIYYAVVVFSPISFSRINQRVNYLFRVLPVGIWLFLYLYYC